MELIVGSYQKHILGYKLLENNGQYELVQSFATQAHDESISCLAACDKFIASGSNDESIVVTKMTTRKVFRGFNQHKGAVTCLEFFKNSHLFSGSVDGTISIMDTKNWECLKTLKCKTGAIRDITIHPSGNLALSVGKDKKIHTWNLVKGRSAFITNLQAEAVSINFSPDGSRFVVVFDRRFDVYQMDREEISVEYSVNTTRFIFSTHFLTDSLLAVAGAKPEIEVYDVDKKELTLVIPAFDKNCPTIFPFDFTPKNSEDKKLCLAAASIDGLKVFCIEEEDDELKFSLLAETELNCRPTCITFWPGIKPKIANSGKENGDEETIEESEVEEEEEALEPSEDDDEPLEISDAEEDEAIDESEAEEESPKAAVKPKNTKKVKFASNVSLENLRKKKSCIENKGDKNTIIGDKKSLKKILKSPASKATPEAVKTKKNKKVKNASKPSLSNENPKKRKSVTFDLEEANGRPIKKKKVRQG